MKLRIFYYFVLFASLNLFGFGQQSEIAKEIINVENNFLNPQTVGYCDLMGKPENYIGKFIRLEATFKSLITLESILYAECEPKLSAVSVSVNDEKLDISSNKVLSGVKTFDNARITVVGKFLGPRKPNAKFNYGHYGWSKYLFEIHAFEKIESVPEK